MARGPSWVLPDQISVISLIFHTVSKASRLPLSCGCSLYRLAGLGWYRDLDGPLPLIFSSLYEFGHPIQCLYNSRCSHKARYVSRLSLSFIGLHKGKMCMARPTRGSTAHATLRTLRYGAEMRQRERSERMDFSALPILLRNQVPAGTFDSISCSSSILSFSVFWRT